MTGLPNARSLQTQFEKEAARASRNGGSFQLLMLDLDGFKAVNDTFGHKTGDRLLKEISRVMRGQLRDYDFLARYAGDEFVVVAPETAAEDVADLCCRIERAVSEFELKVEGSEKSARVGVSIGAASYPQNGETLDQMIAAADKRMYSAKTQHKAAAKQTPQADATTANVLTAPQKPAAEEPRAEESNRDGFIVELSESHVIAASAAIN